MQQIEDHLKSVWETPNPGTLEQYPPNQPPKVDIVISVDQVNDAIMSTKKDTSPGFDRILARTIRDLGVGNIIRTIIDIMLATGCVPAGLSEGKTVLIYKEGDQSLTRNWRPITMYSVVRRIIEKVLDRVLREQLALNHNQRGFIRGMPGCKINADLIGACLVRQER